MPLGEIINTALGNDSNLDFKLYECKECNSTFESTDSRNGMTCLACGSDRVAQAKTVDSHT